MMDDRGVSPVVGTMLLVAVTVVAAGVIAYFVMGLGTPSTAPSANLSAEDNPADNDSILIAHEAGDDLTADKTEIAIENGRNAAVSSENFVTLSAEFTTVGDYFEAGESLKVENDTTVFGPSSSSNLIINPGYWYHVVIRDSASDSKLLDKNVNVK